MIVRAGKAAEVQQLRIDADKKAAVKDLMVQAPIGVKAAMDISMNELSKMHGISENDMTAEVILDLTTQHAGTGGSMMTPRRGTNRTARWSEVKALFESSNARIEASQDSSLDNVPLDRLHAADRRGRMRKQRSPQRQPPQCGICAARGDEATGLVATCRECGDSYHVKCLKDAYETTEQWHECFDGEWMCPGCAQRAGVAAILESEADGVARVRP